MPCVMTKTVCNVSTTNDVQQQMYDKITTIADYDKNVVQKPEQVLNNCNVSIQNSNDVIVGSVTNYNGNVTIIYNVDNETNETVKDEPSSKSRQVGANATLSDLTCSNIKHSEATSATVPSTKIKSCTPVWLMFIGISAIFLILLIVIIVIITNNTQVETTDGDLIETGIITKVYQNQTINYYDRKHWGGRAPLSRRYLKHPVPLVIIAHTAGRQCMSRRFCSEIMRSIQSYHANKFDSPDIGYNFLISGDGNIYIARGWDTVNFSDDGTITIAFMGNYVFDKLNNGQIAAAQRLLLDGVEMGKLSENYTLLAHNQTYNTDSPGKNIYNVIQTWEHWKPGKFYD